VLEQTWPAFLDLLNEDPQEALRAFYSFARRLLIVKPPRPLRKLPHAEAEDLIQEILLHCVCDNFKALRQYTDQGRPFAAWFYILAHNKCMDYIRRRKRETEIIWSDYHNDLNSGRSVANRDISPEEKTGLRNGIRIVRRCMAVLGQYCRLLLELAADEYKPSEMALVLGWPRGMNKKVADDLRGCRRRLKNMLVAQGVDLASLLEIQGR
jgi:RNA polymerase sigma factor (sigma-70 family)